MLFYIDVNRNVIQGAVMFTVMFNVMVTVKYTVMCSLHSKVRPGVIPKTESR